MVNYIPVVGHCEAFALHKSGFDEFGET